jgi:hypothetical protein
MALRDPNTWLPAAGGGNRVYRPRPHDLGMGVDNTPVFGSTEGARDASDYLREASHVGMLATAVTVPGPWSSTLERVLVEEAAAVMTITTTARLKEATDRERRDESDEKSLPSLHS